MSSIIYVSLGMSTTQQSIGHERCSAARSAFYSLNSIGTCFGRLHPLTSLCLYQPLSLPILLYGSEIWTFSKSELLSLERIHRKILRTIQGLPTRCKSSALTTLLGFQFVEPMINHRILPFVVSVANLGEETLPRKILLARANCSTANGLIPRYRTLLSNLNLPDVCSLLSTLSALPGSLFPRITWAVPPIWSFLKNVQSSTSVSAH